MKKVSLEDKDINKVTILTSMDDELQRSMHMFLRQEVEI